MLRSTLFVAAATLASLVSAQQCTSGNTTGTTLSINPGEVDPDLRQSWCLAQTNTCPDICGGSTTANQCDSTSLTYCCTCASGNTPNISNYQQTIPFFICQQYKIDCVNNNPNNLQAQTACHAITCGNLNATSDSTSSSASSGSASTSSSAPSSTGPASSTSSPSGTASGSASGSSSTAKSSSAAVAPALEAGAKYGTGIIAAIAAAFFGFAL